MTIKNRITQLEKRTNPTGFCGCKSTPRFEVWRQDSTSDAEDREPHLTSESIPEKCPSCAQAVDKRVFIMQLVDSESVDKD